jgi:hypothetical protein
VRQSVAPDNPGQADRGTLALDGVDAINPPLRRKAQTARPSSWFPRTPTAHQSAQKIGAIVEEPLAINTTPKRLRAGQAIEMLAKVGLGRERTGATHTCSPAASVNASRSPGR